MPYVNHFDRWVMMIGIGFIFAIMLHGDAPPIGMPSAIGRVIHVNTDGKRLSDAVCTGTLVAPDLVLTAGHCLSYNKGAIHQFEASYNNGKAKARAFGHRIFRLSGRPVTKGKLENDLALLVLDTKISSNIVAPMPLSASRLPYQTLFYGYTRRQAEVMPEYKTCYRLGFFPEEDPSLVGLDCAVESGNSGAPVLFYADNQWKIGAVLVAQGGVHISAFAVIPPKTPPTGKPEDIWILQ